MRRHRPSVHLIVGVFLILFQGLAFGHHFKGLPHFSYFENYPQVPQEEFLGQAGQYEFSLVIYDFQGINKENAEQPDDVRLFLVIYNLKKNMAYNGALTMEILDGDQVLYTDVKKSSEEESLYGLQRELSETGKYSLRLTLHDGTELEAVIPFFLSSQKVNWGKWISIFLLVFVVVLAVGARKARLIADQKEAARARREQGGGS